MKNRLLKNIVLFLALFVTIAILDFSGIKISLTSSALWILFGITALIMIAFSYKRSNYVTSLLNEKGDPDLFLQEIQKDINKGRTEKYKNMLLVNKSAGLIYKGYFKDAANLLFSINPENYKKEFQISYYNNLLITLLSLKRFKEATQLLSKHSNTLKMTTKYPQLNTSVKSTFATYEFYVGDLNKSKNMFNALLNEQLYTLGRASVLYFLGQIDLKENNKEAGTIKLKEAAELGKNTYLVDKIKQLI